MIDIQNKLKFGGEEFRFATSESIEENNDKLVTAAALYRLYESLGDLFGKKIDTTPIENSMDLVSSNGIYKALTKKKDKTEANTNFTLLKANINKLAAALNISNQMDWSGYV